jgi:hypothetical protein
MSGSGEHGFASRVQIGVGVSHADAHAARGGLRDQFLRARQLWSHRHNAYVSSRSLPQFLESADAWNKQVLRRVYSSSHVAQERTFQVNAERLSASSSIVSRGLNCIGESL